MKIMKYFSLLIILTSIFLSAQEKKRDYVKIPKADYCTGSVISRNKLKKLVDKIILYNRLVFGEKKRHQINMASLMEEVRNIIITKSNFNFYEKIYQDAGMYVSTKEEYEEKYAHLKTFEEKASEKLKMMKFPENPNFAELSDEKEIETCTTCIDLLKKYSDATEFLLSERNTKKGNPKYYKATDLENYHKAADIIGEYYKNDCQEILKKINFDKQIQEASGMPFKKFHKVFNLLFDRYRLSNVLHFFIKY